MDAASILYSNSICFTHHIGHESKAGPLARWVVSWQPQSWNNALQGAETRTKRRRACLSIVSVVRESAIDRCLRDQST